MVLAIRAGAGGHLARLGASSLLVDTPEYNCHTTGSDALWSGVPSLSAGGEQMASRVGTSLLAASGLSSGRVYSHKEYVDVAAALVTARSDHRL